MNHPSLSVLSAKKSEATYVGDCVPLGQELVCADWLNVAVLTRGFSMLKWRKFTFISTVCNLKHAISTTFAEEGTQAPSPIPNSAVALSNSLIIKLSH
jgi:hypothetical protein